MAETKIPLNELSLSFGCGAPCSSPCSSNPATAREANSDRNNALQAEGWIARSTIDEPRLSEIANTYRDIGYEVKIVYSDTDALDEDCTLCFDGLTASNRRWGTAHVRKS